MCRLFGFRSTIQSQVHRSLVDADNALGRLSNEHPDGWGVAYYIDGSPHVTRSEATALGDQLFHRVSGVVASETVLAHVRKATKGPVTVLNCHPFQYGRWTFAHNGDVPNFEQHRQAMQEEVLPHFRRFILGETDSEVLFFLFLTHLASHGPVSGRFETDHVVDALRKTIAKTRSICDGPGPDEKAKLTFVATDGSTMAGVQGGKELFWSTHKTRCSDRDRCPNLAPQCEHPTSSGFVNHLVLSSEPVKGENVWNEMAPDDVVAVDWRMHLRVAPLDRRLLPVA
ncbi:MAG: class II glutamine amidotransferase [Myxococcales bacterium]|nr:class II glutamine amidotransferase [Myxococcales bacterium]